MNTIDCKERNIANAQFIRLREKKLSEKESQGDSVW